MSDSVYTEIRRQQFDLLPLETRDTIEATCVRLGIEEATRHRPALLALLEEHAEALVGSDIEGMMAACWRLQNWPEVTE